MSHSLTFIKFGFITAFVILIALPKNSPAADTLNGFLNKGIQFETSDKKFSMNISPRLQVRYAYDQLEGPDNDAHSFMIRRAFIAFTGSFATERFTYNMTLNMNPGGTPSNVIHYGWMNYQFHKSFQIKAGLQKLAFNRQECTSSASLQFIDRALANEHFNLDRSIGVLFHGTPFGDVFQYNFTVANGRGTNANLNANQELLYAVMLNFEPTGKYGCSESDLEPHDKPAVAFTIGSELHHEDTTVSVTQNRVITSNAGLGFKYKGLSINGEFFHRQSENGTANVTDFGYFVQAGYFILPTKLEFALRASSILNDTTNAGGGVYFNNGSLTGIGGANDAVDEGADSDNEHEYSAVVNYYFLGDKLKLQGQYTFMLDGQAGPNDITNHVAMTQLQLQF